MNRYGKLEMDIFSRLAKYRPSEKKENIENFLTELVAHLLRQEPAIREAFVHKLDPNYSKTLSPTDIITQVPTRSRKSELMGKFLDLVIGTEERPEIILEHKVGASLGQTQLDNYLAYAQEKGARVAVIVKSSDRTARDCKHPLYLGQYFWSDFADQWSRIDRISNNYLLGGVLEFMRSWNMGPLEPFLDDELPAHSRWLSMEEKMRRFVAELADKKVDRLAFAQLAGLKYQRLNEPGHLGLGWCAPADNSPGQCHFWYFLGFMYNPDDWYLRLREKGEPECVAFIGVWPNDVGDFVSVAKGLCPILISKNFDVELSENRKGFFLVRRRSLRSFLPSQDQGSAIVNFLSEAHSDLLSSAELPNIYTAYLAQEAGSAPVSHEEPQS